MVKWLGQDLFMLRPDEELAWNGFVSAEANFAGEEVASWVPGRYEKKPSYTRTLRSRCTVGDALCRCMQTPLQQPTK
jgi:hypothetical protein